MEVTAHTFAFQAGDPGSSPGRGIIFFFLFEIWTNKKK